MAFKQAANILRRLPVVGQQLLFGLGSRIVEAAGQLGQIGFIASQLADRLIVYQP